MLVADGLHLFPEVFVQHLLEAVLDDVFHSIVANATAPPPASGLGSGRLLPLLGEAGGGGLVSVHVYGGADCFLVLI